jgi:hypothetical protein
MRELGNGDGWLWDENDWGSLVEQKERLVGMIAFMRWLLPLT